MRQSGRVCLHGIEYIGICGQMCSNEGLLQWLGWSM